jgi:hypothetical protein
VENDYSEYHAARASKTECGVSAAAKTVTRRSGARIIEVRPARAASFPRNADKQKDKPEKPLCRYGGNRFASDGGFSKGSRKK